MRASSWPLLSLSSAGSSDSACSDRAAPPRARRRQSYGRLTAAVTGGPDERQAQRGRQVAPRRRPRRQGARRRAVHRRREGRDVRNRAPNPVAVELAPTVPSPRDVVQCRVRTSLVTEDPDYGIVRYRYRYRWTIGGKTRARSPTWRRCASVNGAAAPRSRTCSVRAPRARARTSAARSPRATAGSPLRPPRRPRQPFRASPRPWSRYVAH
jgi:hypothetical protein